MARLGAAVRGPTPRARPGAEPPRPVPEARDRAGGRRGQRAPPRGVGSSLDGHAASKPPATSGRAARRPSPACGATRGAPRSRRTGGEPRDAASAPRTPIALDDNNYPKHLWSFALRVGPSSSLAPSATNSRISSTTRTTRTGSQWRSSTLDALPRVPYGLYTCASNAVYLPKAFLRPTDNAGLIRGLLQRRAQALYGDFCNLVPPPAALQAAPSPAWAAGAFPWAELVGNVDTVGRFLRFRLEGSRPCSPAMATDEMSLRA